MPREPARQKRAWQLGRVLEPRELVRRELRRALGPRQLVRRELQREQQAGPRELEPLEPAQARTQKKLLASSQAQRVHPGHRP